MNGDFLRAADVDDFADRFSWVINSSTACTQSRTSQKRRDCWPAPYTVMASAGLADEIGKHHAIAARLPRANGIEEPGDHDRQFFFPVREREESSRASEAEQLQRPLVVGRRTRSESSWNGTCRLPYTSEVEAAKTVSFIWRWRTKHFVCRERWWRWCALDLDDQANTDGWAKWKITSDSSRVGEQILFMIESKM